MEEPQRALNSGIFLAGSRDIKMRRRDQAGSKVSVRMCQFHMMDL